MSSRVSLPLIGLFGLVLSSTSTAVDAACESPVGSFVSLKGTVSVQSSGADTWTGANLKTQLCEGDTIRVGRSSRAALALINDAILRIDENTAIRLTDITPVEEETSFLDMVQGAFQSFSRKPKFLRVNSPYLNGSVEGTEFVFRVRDGSSELSVLEGVVLAFNDQGKVAVASGEMAHAADGLAPTKRIVVDPWDQVQWSLYYPPILALNVTNEAGSPVGDAARCASQGDTACAFKRLEDVTDRDAQYHSVRSATLLSVGRVEEASTEIDTMLGKDPNSALGYALRSVINVALNKNEVALADARHAVELDGNSVAARIALSYALQAGLQLEQARDTLLAATGINPDSALAWARLAELQLSLDLRQDALAAAERAAALDPGLSRAHNVLGFTALAETKSAQAQSAFQKAVELDADDPMPHLGLGLAKIRQGDLSGGRKDIEAAVALDSNNALLRAYLGKAYFEERRGPLDAKQLEVAKQLDPLDPTAYFYNALRLQSENRPVEAMSELQAAIDRNDNRAVYRSRLLLDRDQAARGTSLARIYNDLGFKHSGLEEAAKSLTGNPANASAHRFLSDTYMGIPRHGIARVSELLQSQLLQEANTNKVQPSLADVNLVSAAQGGPATAGFNEFTSLFAGNGLGGNVSFKADGNDTTAIEVAATAVYNQFSLAAGGLDYTSAGWRPNNDFSQEVATALGEWTVNGKLKIQAEITTKQAEWGDLDFNWNPSVFSTNTNTDRDTDSWRLGFRYTLSPQTTLLASYIDSSIDTDQLSEFPLGGGIAFGYISRLTEDEGRQWEVEVIHEAERFSLVIGGGHYEIDRDFQTRQWVEFPKGNIIPPGILTSPVTRTSITQPRGFLYTNYEVTDQLVLTLGASYDRYREGDLEVKSFNPKFGVRWQGGDVDVRAAAFKVVKPGYISSRTIEPTQVAGFNQFFDDANGSKSWRYGLGADWRVNKSVTLGAEATWREIDSPVQGVGSIWMNDDYEEQTHRVSLDWAASERLSVTVSGVYDRFESELDTRATSSNPIPTKVETFSLPVGVTYTDPSGVFGSIGATYVDQDVERIAASSLQGTDSFVLVDLAAGYRMPKRYGILTVGVKNIFDEDFMYQDDSFRAFGAEDPYRTPFVPGRVIFGSLTLNF